MFRRCRHTGWLPNLMLAAVLLTAQTVALGHAYQHELGAPQNQACTACVTAGQLGTVCIDNTVVPELPLMPAVDGTHSPAISGSTHHRAPRQRGPPLPL